MKQQVLIEKTIPSNAKGYPELGKDGSCEVVWEDPNGSSVKLIFEKSETFHQAYSKLIALETAKRQETET